MEDSLTFKPINVKSNIRDYSAEFIDNVNSKLTDYKEGETFFIIDHNVIDLYKSELSHILDRFSVVNFESVEPQKSLDRASDIVLSLIEQGFKKNYRLVGIGGGIVQDITGFVASILFRGVSWDLFPTTLLSQADSCIGSKTSINVKDYKNQLGTFFPPENVYVSTTFLGTLNHSEILSGVGEMIKVHLLDNKESFEYLAQNYEAIFRDNQVMLEAIYRSLQIKKRVIEIDEFDRDYRNIMNYGHSFGHAIESVTNYGIPHGQAVTIGMDIANFVSVKMGLLSEEQYTRYEELILKNFPNYDLASLDIDQLILSLSKDKKNIGKRLTLILTKGAGQMDKYVVQSDELFKSWIVAYFEKRINA